ncbi:hypothetical protein ACFQMA_01620 [Halosimplex aquaticum]|uniref:DedA family protein n=1 Tax=Halosimplex aquaticum TaxID=3026162 RepID=A0ABD5XWZ4_9EURY|nr:hypothetical protein [Halosimplex aquaticum]
MYLFEVSRSRSRSGQNARTRPWVSECGTRRLYRRSERRSSRAKRSILRRRIDRAEAYVDEHGFATLLFGAFAPIPRGYELLSIAGSAFGLDRRTYLVASVAGRGGKYFLAAVLALGEAARSLSEPELYGLIGVVSLVAVAAYLLRAR